MALGGLRENTLGCPAATTLQQDEMTNNVLLLPMPVAKVRHNAK